VHMPSADASSCTRILQPEFVLLGTPVEKITLFEKKAGGRDEAKMRLSEYNIATRQWSTAAN
jgi:hypothetical protein